MRFDGKNEHNSKTELNGKSKVNKIEVKYDEIGNNKIVEEKNY